ncbi:hypothetical protein Tco_0828350 [Tanacetum coccineum]
MVSSLNNNEIDLRISFDEFDDEDYTIPKVSCFDDLDFFKDFKNKFPAIVYNDTLTSKSDFLTEPTLSPQHIDEFDLNDETSLFEYDEVEQNVLGGNENTQGSNNLSEGSHDKINKVFIMKSFVMELNVNIMAWNYLVKEMLFNLIKNLYAPFGISFDLIRYYKNGNCTRMLRRQSYKTWLFHPEIRGTSTLGLRDYSILRGAMISGGQFVARLGEHFGLLTEERLQSVLSSKTLGPGYPQDLLGRRVMHNELLRWLRWHQEVVMRMRRCLRLCHHHLGLRVRGLPIKGRGTWAGVTYTRYSESPVEYQRRVVRKRNDEPTTFAAPQLHDP